MPRCPRLPSAHAICTRSTSNGVYRPISRPDQAMNEQILSLINRLDEALIPLAKEGERFDMFHLGRSALVLHYGFQLSTRDVDIVGMQNRELDQKAIELLGEDSPMARSLGIYLDLVPEALPPLPTGSASVADRCRGRGR